MLLHSQPLSEAFILRNMYVDTFIKTPSCYIKALRASPFYSEGINTKWPSSACSNCAFVFLLCQLLLKPIKFSLKIGLNCRFTSLCTLTSCHFCLGRVFIYLFFFSFQSTKAEAAPPWSTYLSKVFSCP